MRLCDWPITPARAAEMELIAWGIVRAVGRHEAPVEVRLGVEVIRFVGLDIRYLTFFLEGNGITLVESYPTIDTPGLPCLPVPKLIDRSAFWHVPNGQLDGRCVINPDTGELCP